jgi:hypothetical protein
VGSRVPSGGHLSCRIRQRVASVPVRLNERSDYTLQVLEGFGCRIAPGTASGQVRGFGNILPFIVLVGSADQTPEPVKFHFILLDN